jgi:hypothetical protein
MLHEQRLNECVVGESVFKFCHFIYPSRSVSVYHTTPGISTMKKPLKQAAFGGDEGALPAH